MVRLRIQDGCDSMLREVPALVSQAPWFEDILRNVFIKCRDFDVASSSIFNDHRTYITFYRGQYRQRSSREYEISLVEGDVRVLKLRDGNSKSTRCSGTFITHVALFLCTAVRKRNDNTGGINRIVYSLSPL